MQCILLLNCYGIIIILLLFYSRTSERVLHAPILVLNTPNIIIYIYIYIYIYYIYIYLVIAWVKEEAKLIKYFTHL